MGQTSIPVSEAVRDRLSEDKPDGMSWSEYLTAMHSELEITVQGTDEGVSHDDLVSAMETAMRNVLPDEVLR